MSATTTRPTAAPVDHEWRLYEDLSCYENEDDEWRLYEDLSCYEDEDDDWRLCEDLSCYEDEDEESSEQPRAQAVIMHGVSPRYRLGILRRWLEEGNDGIEIMGARWLLPREKRLGKTLSSLVVYTRSTENVVGLRMGKRLFSTTVYDWDRPRG